MREFTPEETEHFLATRERRVASAAAWLETPDGKLVILYGQTTSLTGHFLEGLLTQTRHHSKRSSAKSKKRLRSIYR